MNLLLLDPGELQPDGTATLTGRRARHAHEVLRAAHGDTLRVGELGGRVGVAEVLEAAADRLRIAVTLQGEPPPRPGLDLVLAFPRPKALKRILPAAAMLGVDRLVLINAARVEKSYFESKVLAAAFVRDLFVQGLEQARDTRLPELLVRERFRPFVEDELDAVFGPGAVRLLAHPGAEPLGALVSAQTARVVLAVGPDGGWVPFELELLTTRGFRPFGAGERILRTEVAVPALIGAVQERRASRA